MTVVKINSSKVFIVSLMKWLRFFTKLVALLCATIMVCGTYNALKLNYFLDEKYKKK